jgi:hypothetical protein
MKHVSSRELTAYWNERRGTRRAPERGDIDPGAIRQVLGDTFILAVDRAHGHPFRLAGTRVCALFGHELRGESFLHLWSAEDRATLTGLLASCSEEANGVVAQVTGTTRQGWREDLELLVLPLRHRGETLARLIGVLAPLSVPFWLGTARLETVRLGSYRFLEAAEEIAAPPVSSVVVRRQQVFTIYEGSRR